jgi:hypothetical protein
MRIRQATMDKYRIMEIVGNPDFIEGIYNYCDRWCERCPMTAHCAVFAMEKAEANNCLAHDLENEAFWQQLQETLDAALELLSEMSQEAGVDLDAPLSDEERISRDRLEKEAEEHPLVQQAMEYMKRVRKWFEAEELKARMGLPDADSRQEAKALRDIEEVILRYHLLICAKLTRAVKQESGGWPSSLEDMPRDSCGSAKVALISIDRSIASWWQMHSHFPHRKNQVLDFLVRLDSLRRETERAFPEARSFIRPGLDKE